MGVHPSIDTALDRPRPPSECPGSLAGDASDIRIQPQPMPDFHHASLHRIISVNSLLSPLTDILLPSLPKQHLILTISQ